MRLPCVVHLDLKGAPWKVEYLCSVISFMKNNGAWGVLIEWEDTFPFVGELIDIGSLGGYSRDGMYSQGEIKYIIDFIKEKGMEPIQLVQTIGHMEYVLKHGQYKHLRELPRSPAVLCPSRAQSRALVEAIIMQVLSLQPDANYLHIGADEAWHMNICADCQLKSHGQENPAAFLFLDHIKAIISFIKAKYPNIKILMWDDMLRSISADMMKAYELGSLVEPVVWNYNVKENFRIDVKLWERYSFVFPKIWAASAYKGANGSCQLVCSAHRYASNQLAWHEELSVYETEINFSGIILTGWSRYDHYAALCEVLPEALPSLATCLRMWNQPNGFCDGNVVCESLPTDSWPGHEAARAVRAAADVRARADGFLNGDQVTTWLNPWQVKHEYTSPLQADSIAHTARVLGEEVQAKHYAMAESLYRVTGRCSAEELVQTYLAPYTRRLTELTEMAAARAAADPGLTPKYGTQELDVTDE